MADEAKGAQSGGVARLTPYELVFEEADFETRVFPDIRREALGRDEDPARRERFGFLSTAGDALRQMVPPDAAPELLEEYRALLFHAFNFWDAGRCLYLLDPAVARYLVEAGPRLEGWELQLPGRSLYLQLPANLFWASISIDTPPEPVDGFFITVATEEDPLGPTYQDLQLLMVLGMRRNRPGFSVIPFDTEVGAGIPEVWIGTPGRDQGRDFDNVLPGGEMAGLYSILTTTEALKLVARTLWYVDSHPEDVVREPPSERREEDRAGSVVRSRLDFRRVRFGGSDG